MVCPPDFNRVVCAEVQTLDQLWTTYSDGKFGFSAQVQQWQQAIAGFPNDLRTAVDTYGQLVGWTRREPLKDQEFQALWWASDWLTEPELTYDLKTSEGHLPWGGISTEIVADLADQHDSGGCGSCGTDAVYLQAERLYTYLPGFYAQIAQCLSKS
ncbi:MAG: hypothetical protein HC835_07695 [Oscillatoriales cyanobacterium RM2_1_1]|nr:hypothetical protein [Oscillatoriales cyanobacterium RM2_1_1]